MAKKKYTPEELIEHKKARQKAYYERHKERIRIKNNINQKERYTKDPVKTKANYEKNKDKVNARRKELYHQKKEGIPHKVGGPKSILTQEERLERKRERGRQYYHNNKDKHKEAAQEWKINNPDKIISYRKKYYYKKKGINETDFEKLQTIVSEGTYYTKPKKEKYVKVDKKQEEIEYKYYTDKAK